MHPDAVGGSVSIRLVTPEQDDLTGAAIDHAQRQRGGERRDDQVGLAGDEIAAAASRLAADTDARLEHYRAEAEQRQKDELSAVESERAAASAKTISAPVIAKFAEQVVARMRQG